MNILLRTILFFVLPICLCSCNKETEEKIGRIEHSLTVIEKNTANADPVFKLYPTRNMWNFLKLPKYIKQIIIKNDTIKRGGWLLTARTRGQPP